MPSKSEKEHMASVASLGCINCKSRGAQVHHLRGPKWGYGMAVRASNFDTVPLCDPCHDAFHESTKLTKESRIAMQEEWLAKTQRLLHIINTNKGK